MEKYWCTWMSQEVSKRLGSVVFNRNTPHLSVGCKPFTIPLLTSWDIQVANIGVQFSSSQIIAAKVTVDHPKRW